METVLVEAGFAVIERLLGALLEGKNGSKSFQSVFLRLESTLQAIKPIVEETRDRNEVLLQRDEATKILWVQIEKGAALVRECSDIKGCCITVYFKKSSYAKKLDDLDQSVTKFYHIAMEVQRKRQMDRMEEESKKEEERRKKETEQRKRETEEMEERRKREEKKHKKEMEETEMRRRREIEEMKQMRNDIVEMLEAILGELQLTLEFVSIHRWREGLAAGPG